MLLSLLPPPPPYAQVQPIMKKRGWVVPLLVEFYPPNPSLLGLNVGGGGGEWASWPE